MTMHRRQFLRSMTASALATGTGLWSPPVLASPSPAGRRFVFIFNNGGWDTTRVFTPEYSNSAVSMEHDSEAWNVGDLTLVDHADRPSVREFFEAYWDRCVVINGLQIPSIDHFNCTRLSMTGTPSASRADWPALLADSMEDGVTVPHLVLSGPTFPGAYSSSVMRLGATGQLSSLLDPSTYPLGDAPTEGIGTQAEALVDTWLSGTMDNVVANAHSDRAALLAMEYQQAFERGMSLKDEAGNLDVWSVQTFEEQIEAIPSLFSKDLCRSVMIGFPGDFDFKNWDTHASNNGDQTMLFEQLFAGLLSLLDALNAEPAPSGGTLADETVFVVFSEMGRSPALNNLSGKDHWPYTSVLLVGPGLDGGRTVGAMTDLFTGTGFDLASGEVDPHGPLVTFETLGATLLRLLDADPEEYLPGVPPLEGILL